MVSAGSSRFRIAAMDMRGHGETVTDDDADLSAATLVQARRPSCTELLPVALDMHSVQPWAVGMMYSAYLDNIGGIMHLGKWECIRYCGM